MFNIVQYKGCLGIFFFFFLILLPCFTEIPAFNANNSDPDRSPLSDLGLHCSQLSLLWDTRVNVIFTSALSGGCLIVYKRIMEDIIRMLYFTQT